MPPSDFLIQWLLTWVILGVVFFVAADSIQRYLYEVPVDKLVWRVLAVTPLLAAALVKWPLPFQNLFFNFLSTLAHAALWFLACWLGLRFQWPHAAAAGLLAVVTIAPVTSSSVESVTQRFRAEPAAAAAPSPEAPAAAPTATAPTTATPTPAAKK